MGSLITKKHKKMSGAEKKGKTGHGFNMHKPRAHSQKLSGKQPKTV